MKCPFRKKIKVITTQTVGSFANWTELPTEYEEEFMDCVEECAAFCSDSENTIQHCKLMRED